jgi:hypothetical protein
VVKSVNIFEDHCLTFFAKTNFFLKVAPSAGFCWLWLALAASTFSISTQVLEEAATLSACAMTIGITTLRIMTLDIMMLGIITVGIMTLKTMTLCIVTFGI